MRDQPRGTGPRPRPVDGHEAALRSFGWPNSVTRQFDFWDDRYEGRRLFAEALGTLSLVLVAAGGGMVNARFGGDAVPAAAGWSRVPPGEAPRAGEATDRQEKGFS